MFEKLIGIFKFNDLTKFIVLVAVYTVYLTWWASTIANSLTQTSNLALSNNAKLEALSTNMNIQMIVESKLTTTLDSIIKRSEAQDVILQSIIKDHERCSVLLKEILSDYKNRGKQ